jgi:putative exosortase-associated protein (TIGR04073 family)
MQSRWLAVALLVILLAPSFAAADTPVRKLGRGLAAMTTGFLELPGNMVRESRRRGAAEGLPFGFAMGLGMIVVRELVGVYEFLSAPFPAPANYRPILEPEFPWGYFEEGSAGERRARRRSGPSAAPR